MRSARQLSALLSHLPSTQRCISSESLKTVEATLPLVAAAGTNFTAHFYQQLFKAHPELLNVFNLANQGKGRQQKALFSAVAASVISLLETGQLPNDMLEAVHHKHCALDVQPEQYDVVGEHILGTINDLWSPGQEVLDAWAEVYGGLAKACIDRSEELYVQSEKKFGGWRGKRDFILGKKQGISNSVTQFTFVPKDGGPVCDFLPRQYTTLWVRPPESQYQQPRHYNICTVPTEKDYTIAVKKEPGGLVSTYLHDKMAEEDAISLSAPYGDFNIRHADKLWTLDYSIPVVLLSAGVGITPTMSMLASLKNTGRPILWLHAGQSGQEHPFKNYLIAVAASVPEFTRYVWYSDPKPEDIRNENDPLAHYHFEGYMDLKHVQDKLPLQNEHAMYFFCGPLPWMQDIAKQLTGLGVPSGNLAFQTFGPGQDVLPK